jgi:hypothetical protein
MNKKRIKEIWDKILLWAVVSFIFGGGIWLVFHVLFKITADFRVTPT